jgi:hypothetical protein
LDGSATTPEKPSPATGFRRATSVSNPSAASGVMPPGSGMNIETPQSGSSASQSNAT